MNLWSKRNLRHYKWRAGSRITPTSQNFSIINNHNSKAIKHSYSKLIQAVVNKHGKYSTQEHPQFQYGEFIIRALRPQYGYEGDRRDNTNDKK